MKAARTFIQSAVSAKKKVLLLPDRDADGLCGGALLYHTLKLMGLSDIDVYFMKKGQNVHQPEVIEEVKKREPQSVFVIDQGSRPEKLGFGTPTLIIDHHASLHFPPDATILSGFRDPLGPDSIPPSSLLTYDCCKELHSDIATKYDWLAIMGTHGDLGTSFGWPAPFPQSLKNAISKYGRDNITKAVSLVNAPRRTYKADPTSAWKVLISSLSPKNIIESESEDVEYLYKCREQVNGEVARCARFPPRFSNDGSIAMVRFSSLSQVHPVVASRWASSLKNNNDKSKTKTSSNNSNNNNNNKNNNENDKLQMVIAANDGYLLGYVNFAARIAAVAKKRGENIDLIQILKNLVKDDPEFLSELGENFARGHAQATGGIVPIEQFEKLLEKLGFEKREKKEKIKKKVQKTTLFDVGIQRRNQPENK